MSFPTPCTSEFTRLRFSLQQSTSHPAALPPGRVSAVQIRPSLTSSSNASGSARDSISRRRCLIASFSASAGSLGVDVPAASPPMSKHWSSPDTLYQTPMASRRPESIASTPPLPFPLTGGDAMVASPQSTETTIPSSVCTSKVTFFKLPRTSTPKSSRPTWSHATRTGHAGIGKSLFPTANVM